MGLLQGENYQPQLNLFYLGLSSLSHTEQNIVTALFL